MAEPRRSKRNPLRSGLRLLPPIMVRRRVETPVRRAAIPSSMKSSPKSMAHRVEKIVQFKSKKTGRYFLAVYTHNPSTKKQERFVVDPQTLPMEKMKQLKALHQKLKHHEARGNWMHSLMTDPHTWAVIGKILLAA